MSEKRSKKHKKAEGANVEVIATVTTTMITRTKFMHLASRSINGSCRRSISTAVGGGCVSSDVLDGCGNSQRCGRPITNQKTPASVSASKVSGLFANTQQTRYFSGKKGGEIDRSKFTHETKVVFPDVSDDDAGFDGKGVIEKWYKKEGDIIKRDEVICDIRTEQFTFGMLTDDDYDSIMGKILVPEEVKPITPGTEICVTLSEEHGEKSEDQDE